LVALSVYLPDRNPDPKEATGGQIHYGDLGKILKALKLTIVMEVKNEPGRYL
jgi:hypothetical protein